MAQLHTHILLPSNTLLFREPTLELTFCDRQFCCLRKKNLICGCLPDFPAFFTSQLPNPDHLFNHSFSPKMRLIIALESSSLFLPLAKFSHFSQPRQAVHDIYQIISLPKSHFRTSAFLATLTEGKQILQPDARKILHVDF